MLKLGKAPHPALVGRYDLLGDVGGITPDMSGFGNDGTLNGGVVLTPWGYDFDGAAGSYIDCGTDSSLRFTTGDFSVLAKIKFTLDDAVYRGIVADEQFPNGWALAVQQKQLNFLDTAWHVLSTQELNDDIFHWVAFSRSGTVLTPYIDNVMLDKLTVPADLNSPAAAFEIGRYLADREFNGTINKVMVYNRALTQREIREEMRGFKSSFELVA